MTIAISVVIPAHNPRVDYLVAALGALKAQTLALNRWELVIIDNASSPPLAGRIDIDWHPLARIVTEAKLGLTHARLQGLEQSVGSIVVFVDDDNVLAPDYLSTVLTIADLHPFIGVWGGVIAPRFEDPALAPPKSASALLTLRSAAHDSWSNDPNHHASTPWGAGLCLRRSVSARYRDELSSDARRQALDVQGNRLLYGGDTDMAFTACRMGMGKGVFPALKVEHLIPAARCSLDYLCRVAAGRGYSEVLHTLILTGAIPETPTVGTRIRRIYTMLRASAFDRRLMHAHDEGRRQATKDLL